MRCCPSEIQETRREMFESFTASAGRTLREGRPAGATTRRGDRRAARPAGRAGCRVGEPRRRAAGGVRRRDGPALGRARPRDRTISGRSSREPSSTPTNTRPSSARGAAVLVRLATGLERSDDAGAGIDRKREVGTEHLLAGLLTSAGRPAELLKAAGLEPRQLARAPDGSHRGGYSPLAPVQGIPPLDLGEPGGGVDLARILDASANRAGKGCGSSRITFGSCSTIPGSPSDSRRFATGWPRPSAGSMLIFCSAPAIPATTSAPTS